MYFVSELRIAVSPLSPSLQLYYTHRDREQLIELAVEQDEKVLMDYLDGEEPDVKTLKSCIRIGA